MKFTQVAVFLVGLAFLSPSVSAQPVPQWAKDWLGEWYAAYNARDAARLALLYAEDAVTTSANKPAVRGRSAIEASFKAEFDTVDPEVKGAMEGARVMNDLAVIWGYDEDSSRPIGLEGGEFPTTKVNWLAVLEKQADGSWLAIRETSSRAKPESD